MSACVQHPLTRSASLHDVDHELARGADIRDGVSLRQGARFPTAKQITGGSAHTALKKLKGARLVTPSRESVETSAIGRGTIEVTRSA